MNKKEYIERDSLICQIASEQNRLRSCDDHVWERNKKYFRGLAWARRFALDAPAADVVPVVHGRWITDENTEGYMGDTQCTACKGFLGEYDMYICKPGENSFFYCPNCGAKMDGATDNNVGDKGGERKE